MPEPAARAVEIRVLEGPNLYFPRPAVKVTIEISGWMNAGEARVALVSEAIGVSGRPGAPGTEQRRRTVGRIAARWTRLLAETQKVRLAVRSRSASAPDEIVVAFPWRSRGAAEALATELVTGMGSLLRRSADRLAAESAKRLAAAEPGEAPSIEDPSIPVIQVTGTNGKTTTVRLLAHLVRSAGKMVAYSSTDGVYGTDGSLVEAGDYSGFGGAERALAEHPDIAVLETARGGILLRGIGVLHNDVAVVTNISEDHLGLHGVETLDQLAEVKATITKITRAQGWVVLNADDPRVLAMRRGARGKLWLFTRDPDHPSIPGVLERGGRVTTIYDGALNWLEGHDSHRLVGLIDIPSTLAGLSSVYTQNAMAAATAALAIGLPERDVVRGLKTFILDPETNPGRANLFELDGRIVVIDYAHNEAGMIGLTEVLNGLRRKGSEVWMAICTAGDRTDEILHSFAFRAAVGSDHLAIAELLHYLRGRTREDIVERLREGARQAGVDDVPEYEDVLHALRGMLREARPGDVVSVTALSLRTEIFGWLEGVGARKLNATDVRRLVRAVMT